MKIIKIKIVSLLVVATALFGCSKQLDLAPISEIGDNGFYTNTDEIRGAIYAIYDGWQAVPAREFALTEMRSDNTQSSNSEGDWAQFESYEVLPTNVAIGDYWSSNYNVIFRANAVLEHLDVVEDETLRAEFEGEAKFTRALAHFNLTRAFGDVPMIDKVIIQTDEEYFGAVAQSTVMSFIEQDFTDASNTLPEVSPFGRATAGAARGMLAKVKLTLGDYAGAKTLLSDIMASGVYALENEYRDVFYDEGNSEILFAIPYVDDDANESQDFSYEFTAFGVRGGLNYLTNNFLNNMDTGEFIRRPVLVSPDNAKEPEVGKFLTSSADARKCGNDWIVLRYADILLLYAEAILGNADLTLDVEAIKAYNDVRDRAGMPTLATDGTAELTKEMLINERRYELAFENHRFYDLVRFGVASQVLGDFAASSGYTLSPTDLILPIPQAEINVSKGKLKQNPGY